MYQKIIATLSLCLLPALSASDASGQGRRPCPVAEAGKVVVYGDVASPIVLTVADLLALPQASVRGTPHGGEPSDYAGPRLEDVLAPANLPRGPQLRGSEVSRYVVAEAVDGYRALFALAEFDTDFRAEVPILALRQNGAPLDAESGPFQVVVPGEMRHARWVRQVSCLRISRDPGIER